MNLFPEDLIKQIAPTSGGGDIKEEKSGSKSVNRFKRAALAVSAVHHIKNLVKRKRRSIE